MPSDDVVGVEGVVAPYAVAARREIKDPLPLDVRRTVLRLTVRPHDKEVQV